MKVAMEMTGLEDVLTDMEQQLAAGVTKSMVQGAAELKADLRDQVIGSGLGQRLARTWRSKVYPAGRPSLDAAAWVWTRAPKIIDAHDRGVTIVPTDGRWYLALPTLNTPRRGRHVLTPLEVETMFDQDLIIRKGRNGSLLAYVDVQAKAWLAAQGKAYGSRGSKAQYKARPRGKPILKLMFVLVRRVRLRKRLDIDAAADKAAGRTVGLMAQNWRG